MKPKKRLGEMLIEAGVIDQVQLEAALAHQRKWGGKLGQALVDLQLATEAQILGSLSRKLGYEIVDVAALQRTTQLDDALKLVPRDVAVRHTLLPITLASGSLTVAMSDPSNIAVVDELAFRTGRRIKIALAGDRALTDAVERLYFKNEARPPAAAAQRRVTTSSSGTRSRPDGTADGAGRREALGSGMGGRQLKPREAVMLDSLHRVMRGEETAAVKPAQVAAALLRLLVRKGLVTEAELVEELVKP